MFSDGLRWVLEKVVQPERGQDQHVENHCLSPKGKGFPRRQWGLSVPIGHHCQGAAESGELSLSTSSFTTEPGFQVKSGICGYWVSLWHLPLFLNSPPPHCSWESWVLDLSPWYTLTEAWSRESEQGPSLWLMLSTVWHKELKPQLCRMKATSFWSRSLWIYWIWIYQSLLFYKQSQSQKSSQIFGNNRLWRQGGSTFCTRKRVWSKMTNKKQNKTKYKLKSLETAQLTINWWTSRQIEGQPHKGIGLRRKGTNIWHTQQCLSLRSIWRMKDARWKGLYTVEHC